ncbi:molybdate ABC transporter substrate-binding protein [Halobacillus sp. A1]|uniref:molybdate ABC transporter substrate-binding protein n=1 Tax=Halobacillus sp. A1 TaxID=2880262 RepID=UPI0020A64892|nr:molybdate ABC transporter substrate-binding protein [Halobacillus sp. A1]MCP3032254.1 molybdate ABC transporter substrate-binding protein [Halobacillus sp. A1]
MYTKMIAFCFSLLFITGCSNEESRDIELTISVASSLTEAMEEIVDEFESDHEDVTVTVNTGSSGKLAQQIQQGAPVDVFMSANEHWVERLRKEGHLRKDTIKDVTHNSLVLIAPSDSSADITSLEQLQLEENETFALGDPKSAPIGMYSKQSLQAANQWDKYLEQFVYSSDVKQVVAYVASHNASYGLVYVSDAMISDDVKVIAEIDEETHDPVVYPAAVTNQTTETNTSKEFIEFIEADKAQSILEKYGFSSK